MVFLTDSANTVADTVSQLSDMRKIEWIAYHDHSQGCQTVCFSEGGSTLRLAAPSARRYAGRRVY